MGDTEYYNILEVEKTANEAEIKRAYKKKAMQLHPDRNTDNNKSAEQFKTLGVAYSVLSDSNKRAMYDRFGKKGLDGPDMKGGNPFEMFEEIFNGGDIFESMAGGGGPSPQMFGGLFGPGIEIRMGGPGMRCNVPSIGVNIECSLEDIYNGCERTINYSRNNNGKSERMTKVIKIPKGIPNNEKIVLENEGHINGNTFGNVVVIVHELKHDIFKRSGDDLIYEKDILLSEALCGLSFPIKGLDKKYIIVESKDIIHPNSIQKCPGQGMPCKYGDRGNLFVKINIDFPRELDKKRKDYLLKILPVDKRTKPYPSEFKRVLMDETSDSDESIGDDSIHEERHSGRPECATQ